MHDESSITPATIRDGVLTLTGYRVRVTVEKGYLTVHDGICDQHREGRFPRTTRDLKRLVIIGHSGFISFHALQWLFERGAGFLQLDPDGTVIAASGPVGSDDARLRRAQACAAVNASGMAIARDLMTAKIDGQARVLDTIETASDAAAAVRQWRDALANAPDLSTIRTIESQAAAEYWAAWADVPVTFSRRMAARVPEHWRTFGSRSSPLTGSPRLASNPPNAIMNYLHSLVEAEARIALLAVGLDPGFGIVHADQRWRDNFACDVQEAVRPAVDAFVLDLVRSRPFGHDDFYERSDGCCRIMPTLTRPLSDTSRQWAALLAPVVERIVRRLQVDGSITAGVGTPLTQANRRDGRARVKAKQTPQLPHRRSGKSSDATPSTVGTLSPSRSLLAACRECGVKLSDPHRMYCDNCLPTVQAAQVSTFASSGPAALAERRAGGDDPAHGGAAGVARGARNAAHFAALADWQDAGDDDGLPPDVDFRRDILPGLQTRTLRELAAATDLTPGYCSFVRRGLRVPHRRHWAALARLAAPHDGSRHGGVPKLSI